MEHKNLYEATNKQYKMLDFLCTIRKIINGEFTMLKDLIHAGIGAAVVMREKVEEEVKKLEESGKLKTTDAKSFLDSIEKKGQEEQTRVKEELKSTLKEVIDELGLATKADLEKLKEDLK
jgi:polyhydroxyalkanoate synthesis regulator phasin